MHQFLATLELKALEKLYSKETEILKFKLLSGAFRKEILKQENKAIELALMIHKKQCTERVAFNNFSFKQV